MGDSELAALVRASDLALEEIAYMMAAVEASKAELEEVEVSVLEVELAARLAQQLRPGRSCPQVP